ncbi:MAG: DUF4336 domain-containing protein [Cyanobacteriota bacterium]|nr:DUF4336 domain-containing protein [Cyanobacteriota bacterium]
MQQSMRSRDFSWPWWPAAPLYPYGQRRTLRREVIKDTLWTFDQLQGILYVVVPIRMTVVKLEQGGLLVYAPVAPTPECIRLVRELVTQHGDVKYIILPTTSGIEHKVFVGPFARQFSQAHVFVAPRQWSFPFNLPLSWLGLPRNRTHILPEDSSKVPFSNQFDYAILGSIELGLGKFSEVVFFDRRSRTLLVTDIVVSIPESPPEILKLDPYPLLFHARDHAFDEIVDNEENRLKGWQRICLFSFYFRPSALDPVPFREALKEAQKAPERSSKAYFGLYPFRWKPEWKQSFQALCKNQKLLVAPVLQTLILNRASTETLIWADWVKNWQFERIIPCHFDSPILANPEQFRQAFCFLEKTVFNSVSHQSSVLPEEDFELLREIDETLSKRKIIPPV